MQLSPNNHRWQIGVIVGLLSASISASAGNMISKKTNLAGLFSKELAAHGNAEIVSQPDYCISKTRPLKVNQELSEMLAHSARSSNVFNMKTECEKVKGQGVNQFCRFYFHSAKKSEQWSIGFSFLGNPSTGEIDFNSLECFATP